MIEVINLNLVRFALRVCWPRQCYGVIFRSICVQCTSSGSAGWGRTSSHNHTTGKYTRNTQSAHVYSPSDSSPSSGYGVSQWREGESCASHLPPHVLCLPLPEKPQVSNDPHSLFHFFCVYIVCKFIMCPTFLFFFCPSLSLSPSVPIICPVSVQGLSCWTAWVVMHTLSVPGKRKCWSSSWILCSSLWRCRVSASRTLHFLLNYSSNDHRGSIGVYINAKTCWG